ncbi:hypothetical protein [Streptomyces filamentosus]|uniref:hypothetical protein n=1 Tax=Streptomyces filamentosus TaxID=67294 RepID=UPI00123B01A5|nr:hypothetical protein [Streptomyces filamentosus]
MEFLSAYLDAEFEEARAVRQGSDAVLRRRTEASEDFMYSVPGYIMASVYGRPPMTESQLEEYALTVDQVAHRKLFLVSEHRHRNWASLFAGYISGDSPLSLGAYGLLLYCAEIEGGLKIISSYYPEPLSVEVPTVWRHAGGVEFDDVDSAVRVQAIEAPKRPEHLRDWDMRRELAAES